MAVEVGALLEGKVTGIIEYGAFIDLGEGKTGMVHISEVAPTYVTNIREYLVIGQEVHVKVMAISPEGKVSLSIKKAAPPLEPGAPPPAKIVGGGAGAPPRPQRRSAPNVWQGQRSAAPAGGATFEDMMSQFKQTSEDKISTLRRGGDTRFGNTAPRRGGGGSSGNGNGSG
ncbi:MAG: S1 RNA-binding domain-containing protein, partial [Oscillospiraceae bacterium]|nr:S1 RNA-binding domain-containing protein [Oscillospiraceae bacterium]